MDVLLNTFAIALLSLSPDLPSGSEHRAEDGRWVQSSHFELTKEGKGDEPAENVAVVALRRIETKDKTLFEREVVFASSGVRVQHTEEVTGDHRRLVWREFRPTGARTWVAEWGPDVVCKSTGYGWHRPVHEPLGRTPENRPPGVGPLELMFLLRGGGVEHGQTIALVDPTAARVVDVEVDCADGVLEARRADGTLGAGWVQRDVANVDRSQGVARQWIPSCASSAIDVEPIPEGRFARSRQRWLVPTRPAHDRILSRIVWPERRRELYARPGSVRRL